LIYTMYLSYTHDTSTLRMVRQATDVDIGKHENKDKKDMRASSVTCDNANLDRYVI
jgi:hypothetical protein